MARLILAHLSEPARGKVSETDDHLDHHDAAPSVVPIRRIAILERSKWSARVVTVEIAIEKSMPMRKLVVSEWVSLDGVFDADTMTQWFHPYDSKDRQDRISELVLASDAFLFGRVTYEMLAGYWPKVKNNDKGDLEIANRLNSSPKYVVSSTLKKADWNNSAVISQNVVKEIAALKQQPGHDILVFGSATLVESLMEADLVDEYRLLVHPIIMGSGKRAFKEGMTTTKLKLGETTTLTSGVISLCYQRAQN